MRTIADDYAQRGPRFQTAFEILADRCADKPGCLPPSLEVFEHEYDLEHERQLSLTPEAFARRMKIERTAWTGFRGSEDEDSLG